MILYCAMSYIRDGAVLVLVLVLLAAIWLLALDPAKRASDRR